ncbi:hypothetical protein C8R43DRAFT_1173898, partial [Mycena crocata]
MSFLKYSTPSQDSTFSAEYFAALTVADADQIIRVHALPHILPKKSVTKWLFDRTEPTDASEYVIGSSEVIPCVDDMYPITKLVEEAFYKEGARSICLEFGGNFFRYHLSKIRLIMNVNNQSYNLRAASGILRRVVASSLLPADLIAELKSNKCSEPLAGFYGTRTPLHSLSCLLDENWALEDVLNARAELSYFRHAATTLGQDPSFLFLTTHFINECRRLHDAPNQPYSSNLVDLRERIRAGFVQTIGFVSWTTDHYSALVKCSVEDFEHGDSLHHDISPDLIPILCWAFGGLRNYQSCQPKTGTIDLQSPVFGGGSCGIAAVNFVEVRGGLPVQRWRAWESAQFRDEYLRDLLLYHLLARKKATTYADWVVPCARVANDEVPGFTFHIATG